MPKAEMAAGEFKARCLSVLDEVAQTRTEMVVTKRGKPVARVVPVEADAAPELFGALAGRIRIIGDVVSPVEDEWDANR